jgi:hypothetical protein
VSRGERTILAPGIMALLETNGLPTAFADGVAFLGACDPYGRIVWFTCGTPEALEQLAAATNEQWDLVWLRVPALQLVRKGDES